MAEKIKLDVGNVLTTLEVTDDSGFVIGTAEINLFDIRLASRIGEIAEYFRSFDFAGFGPQRMAGMDAALIDKMSYLLGYDCRESLFGILSPTTILPDGEMFIMRIIEKIDESFTPAIQERAKARAEKIAQYAQRYAK